MRIMKRNRIPVYYCKYLGTEDIVDGNGYRTGEKTIQYSDPLMIMCNVAKNTGSAQIAVFGNLPTYDRLIIYDDPNLDVDESTVFFIDKEPEFKDGKPLFNYIVKRVAPSINSISIALSEVKTS